MDEKEWKITMVWVRLIEIGGVKVQIGIVPNITYSRSVWKQINWFYGKFRVKIGII